jgi:hypothetical protein
MSKLGALRHTATWFPLPLYDMPSMVCLDAEQYGEERHHKIKRE